MSRNNFDTLLDKYLAGHCTAEENRLVEQWYALLDNQDMENPKDMDTIKNKIWLKIQNDIQPIAKVIPLRHRPIFKYLAAASVFLLLSVGVLFFIKKENTPINFITTHTDVLKQKNTSDKIITLTMEDGSQIDLLPQAELTYPKQFSSEKREVALKGEAFFQIAKNPLRPFLVYANGTITKVLGTSFTIRAIENEKIVTVLVKTGKVSVYTATPRTIKRNNTDPETQGVVVTPNQKVVFDLKTDNIQKTVVEKPSLLIPLSKTEDFTFTEASMITIFETMEKIYGIDIVYDEELLKNCTLTTSLTDVPMFDKLKIICAAIGATYKEIDAQIVISAKGCS